MSDQSEEQQLLDLGPNPRQLELGKRDPKEILQMLSQTRNPEEVPVDQVLASQEEARPFYENADCDNIDTVMANGELSAQTRLNALQKNKYAGQPLAALGKLLKNRDPTFLNSFNEARQIIDPFRNVPTRCFKDKGKTFEWRKNQEETFFNQQMAYLSAKLKVTMASLPATLKRMKAISIKENLVPRNISMGKFRDLVTLDDFPDIMDAYSQQNVNKVKRISQNHPDMYNLFQQLVKAIQQDTTDLQTNNRNQPYSKQQLVYKNRPQRYEINEDEPEEIDRYIIAGPSHKEVKWHPSPDITYQPIQALICPESYAFPYPITNPTMLAFTADSVSITLPKKFNTFVFVPSTGK